MKSLINQYVEYRKDAAKPQPYDFQNVEVKCFERNNQYDALDSGLKNRNKKKVFTII